jgi:multidrug efflux pump subunit AcrB
MKIDPGDGNPADRFRKSQVRNSDGQMVPLSDFVSLREAEVLAAAERLNGSPMVALTANPVPGVSLAQARALCEMRAEEIRRELGLSDEYRLAWL